VSVLLRQAQGFEADHATISEAGLARSTPTPPHAGGVMACDSTSVSERERVHSRPSCAGRVRLCLCV
jgi:hypothetical protein